MLPVDVVPVSHDVEGGGHAGGVVLVVSVPPLPAGSGGVGVEVVVVVEGDVDEYVEVVSVPVSVLEQLPPTAPVCAHGPAVPDWSVDVVSVDVVVVVALVDVPLPDWSQFVTCGATRKIWIPACFNAPFNESLACLYGSA